MKKCSISTEENERKVYMMKQLNPNAVYRVNSAGHLAMVEKYDPSTMVIKTLTPGMRLTPEQVAMLEEAEQYPIVYEDDCPEMTPKMAAAFKRAAEMRDKRKAVAF